MGSLPLSDVVVLDLSDEATVVGPRLLGELGARVIRVEPLAGEPLRQRAPFVDGVPGVERSMAHLLYNAGKESVALDLEHEDSWDLIGRLAEAMDVVIAPLAKSRRARAFFQEFETAHSAVGLVDVVFRRDHPDVEATDLTAVAAGGLLYCHGYPDQAPDYPAGNLGYKQLAFLVATTAVALITQRRRRGLGGRARVSLQEAVTSTVIQADNQNYRHWGIADPRFRLNPRRALHRSADGFYLAIAANPVAAETIPIWYEEATGRPCPYTIAFESDPMRGRPTGVREAIEEICAARPRDWLIRRGQELRQFVTPINRVTDIVADPQLDTRGYFPEVEHPALGRALRLVRSPFRSSLADPRAKAAPSLGENSTAVLREFASLSSGEVWELRERGIVGGGEGASAATAVQGPGRRPATAPRAPNQRPSGPLRREDLPLAGVRILDFCWMAAGPLVTELLANLGADVVKVESATGLDRVRSATLAPAHPTLDHSAFFNDCNTDKRSITLNLRRPEANELIMRMLPAFDVVTSNYTPGTMEKWGLGYEALRAARPDIIAATYSALGESGPHRGWKAIGNGVSGMSGITWRTGQPDRPPAGLGLPTDFSLAPLGATQIMAALLQRDRTGEGQLLEIAQYEAALHLLDTELIDCLNNGREAPRRGNHSAHHVPHGVFPCRGDDRWLSFVVRDGAEWRGLCAAMGRSDLAARPDLEDVEGRRAAEDEIEAAISAWSASQDAWELADRLHEHGVPASAAQDMDDIVKRDPGMHEFFFEYEHEGIEFRIQHQPFTWDGQRLPTRRSPFLGEHNVQIFSDDLGLSDERVAELVDQGVIA